MAIVSDVEIRLRADIARLQQDLNRARGEVNGALNQMTRAVDQFKNVFKSLGVGIGLGALVGQVISAQREFDKLNASLITITGSSKSAREVFGVLQEFAAKTPYSLQEVTEGFLKLRNLGLTPSERALTSYGNTASAMGKNLNQLIEAVADAATGEFERLKEFGIKSKQQGDQVAFTFQGVTTKVGNNAAEIEKYLMRIGEVNFAGAMALQANTLDGDLSALADTWNRTLTAFSTSGFGDMVRGSVKALSDALVDLQAMFKAASGEAAKQGETVERISPIYEGLRTFFEALLVVGTNVAYVFKTIGKDIGAFAAQAAVLFTGGFKGLIDGSTLRSVQEIGRARVAEAQEERRQVDATSEAILNAAKKAEEARNSSSKQTKDRLEGLKIETQAVQGLSDAQKKAADAAKKTEADRLQKYTALIDAAQQAVVVTSREAAGLDALTRSQQMAMDLDQGLTSGKIKLTAAEEGYYRALIEAIGANEDMIRANEAAKKAADEERKAVEALAAQRKQSLDAARAEAESAEQAVLTFGMSAQAIEQLTVARLEDQRAQLLAVEGNEKEIAYLTELIELKQRNADAVGQLAELEKTRDMWESIEKTAHDTFVSIMDGGKNAATRLKDTFKNIFFDWLYQQTLKKWIINLQGNATTGGGDALSSLAGMFTGGGSSGGGGGGSILGTASNLLSIGKTIYSGFSTGIASSLGTMITQLGTTFGSTAVASFGAGMSGAAGTGLASGTAAGAGASAASAIPIIGWIIAGMNAANGFFKQGFDMQNGTVKDPLGLGSGIKTFDKLLRGIGLNDKLANIFSGQAVFAKLFGRANPVIAEQGIEGFANTSGFGGQAFAKIFEKGGIFRSDKTTWKTSALSSEMEKFFDDSITGIVSAVSDMGKTLGAEVGVLGGYSKQLRLVLGKDEEANKKLIADTFAGIGDDLANLLVPNLKNFAAEGESATATLQRLAGEFQTVNAVFEAMGVNVATAFGAVGIASLDARKRLIDLAGGVDALAQQSTFFAQNFLSSAEQIAPVQKALTEQLAAIGYAGVDTTEEFKAAVMGLANSGAIATEAGAKTYATLLALAPAFKQVMDFTAQLAAEQAAAADAAKAAADAEKELAAEREAAAVQGLRDAAAGAFDVLSRSIDGQKEILKARFDSLLATLAERITAQQNKIGRLSSLQSALSGARAGDASDMQLQANRMQGQAQILSALAIAKASGVLPTADSLKDALSAVSRDAADQFATFVEYQRDQLRTQNNIEELSGLTTDQLSTAERTLAVLEKQRDDAQRRYDAEVARLDGLLASAQLQIDAINGVNLTAMNVVSAFAAFQATITAALGNKTIANGPSSAEAQIEKLYQDVFGRKADIGGLSYYSNLLRGGTSLGDIEAGLRASEEYKAMQRSGMYSVQQTGTMGAGNSAVVAELQTMNARISNIEGHTGSTAKSSGQQAAQIDRVTAGGNVMLTEGA